MPNNNRKFWYGPAYILEGFMFATGIHNKSPFLTITSFTGAIVTTIADLNARRLDIKDAKRAERAKLEVAE